MFFNKNLVVIKFHVFQIEKVPVERLDYFSVYFQLKYNENILP